MASILTKLALDNADLLRALKLGTFVSNPALAEHLGRDTSNVRKSLVALHEVALINAPTAAADLTEAGREMVAALDRADDVPEDGQPGMGTPAGYAVVRHDQIFTGPLNPRKDFDSEAAQAALSELATSIEKDGLLENLVVRVADCMETAPFTADGRPRYELVAGERRWRAMGLLIEGGQWPADTEILVKVSDLDEAGHRRVALVENLQRRDLKPLEEARALQELIGVTGVGTAEIAADIGFTQRWAQQRLQLLQLTPKMQARLEEGGITVEGARSVVAMWDRLPDIKRVELEAGRTSVEAVKAWLADQPEPLSLRAKLALAEFLSTAQKGVGGSYYAAAMVQGVTERRDDGGNGTKITVKVDDHGVIAELNKRNITDRSAQRTFEEGVETGRHHLAIGYWGEENAKHALPGVTDAKKRPALVGELRVELLGADAAAAIPEGQFATAWLNGPFENAPGVDDEVAAKRAAREKRDAEWRANREAEDAKEAAARKVRQEKLTAAAACDAVLHTAVETGPGALRGLVANLASETGLALPLFLDTNGELYDGRGAQLGSAARSDWQNIDQRAPVRLLVGIINAAAGLETPATRPVPIDPDAIDRDEFTQVIAVALMQADSGLSAEAARANAVRGLEDWLRDDGVTYGEEGYDWTADGAVALAQEILSHSDTDTQDADATEAAA